jgi:hypothetical protein
MKRSYLMAGAGAAVLAVVAVAASQRKKKPTAGGTMGDIIVPAPTVPGTTSPKPPTTGTPAPANSAWVLRENGTATNFTYAEGAVSASHPSLVKPIPDALKPSWRRVVLQGLQPARDWLRSALYVDSGYRPAALNNAVDGSDTSQHLVAEAADVTTRNFNRNRQLFVAMMTGQVPGLQVGQVIFYPAKGGFIHVAIPGSTYKRATFQVHNPARGHNYHSVTTDAQLRALGY